MISQKKTSMNAQAPTLLIVDDEQALCHMLQLLLEPEGYAVATASNGEQALERLRQETFSYVLADIRMPRLDGHGLLRQAQAEGLTTTFIMMSAYGTVDTALQCMREGAYDYIAKPFKNEEILLTLKKAAERQRLQQENAQLHSSLQQARLEEFLGASPAIAEVRRLIAQVADTNASVLLYGETGTGKELAARALHRLSRRSEQPFVALNCSALSPELAESELFGHQKGAFTGANQSRPGLFQAAHRGSLFLDEIGELPASIQPKLLRALQEGEVRPVGSTQDQSVDVRLITATSRQLDAAASNFRSDLYYRLAVVTIELPPLRQRPQDIPALGQHFLQRSAARLQRPEPTLTTDAWQRLQQHHWHGNVRELENYMEKIVIFCQHSPVTANHLPAGLSSDSPPAAPGQNLSLKQAVSELEQHYIRQALEASGGNRTQAAKLLDISLRSLHYKMKEMGA